MGEPLRVLSIDGGGIRGIIPAAVLAEVEERTGKPVAETFDLIAGTSTGGILALALTLPGGDGRPAWAAADLLRLYEEQGPRIFSRSLWHRIRSADGLLDERYPSDGLEAAFSEYLGDARLHEALTDVIVTAYDIERRTTFYFKSRKARADGRDDFPMWVAAQATSAAPTYFEPVCVDRGPGAQHLALVDGGVFAINPGMSAYAEAMRRDGGRDAGHDRDPPELLMLSLGTGELTRPLRWSKAKDWGLVEWARPILDVVFDSVSDATDYHLERLLGPERYYRFQTTLDVASDDLDDASEANLERLRHEAAELLADEGERLEEVCAKLRGGAGGAPEPSGRP